MQIRLLLPFLAALILAGLSGCTSVNLTHISPTVMQPPDRHTSTKERTTNGTTTNETTADEAANKGPADKQAPKIFPCKKDITFKNTHWLEVNADDARQKLPEPLQGDPVVLQLTNAVAYQVASGRRAALVFLGNTVEQAEGAVPATSAGGKLSNGDFKRFAETLAATALNPVVPAKPGVRSAQATGATLLDYYNAYYNDGFHDRFGVAIVKPKNMRNISDDDIAGAVSIALEFLMDALLNTPVWQEGENYYPGKFTEPPSVLELNGIKPEPLLDETKSAECGITPLKAQAIAYLSKAASDRAGMVGGLTTGSFGGLHFGLGVLGKWSIGDNQTLQVVVKTALSRAFARGAEQMSYEILEYIGYQGDTISDLLEYVFDQGKL